jgi:hypothetical protein
VASDTVAVRCAPPRTVPDFHSWRAPCPWYQPSRYAVTANEREVVDTNSGSGSPASTLAWPAYPSISCAVPRWRITQSEVPGSEFSGTGLRHARAVAACGLGATASLQADTAPATPAAARPRNALRLVCPSTRASIPCIQRPLRW